MNDAVYKFKRYEDASLEYIGINKHEGEDIGLFDTVLSKQDYEDSFENINDILSVVGLLSDPDVDLLKLQFSTIDNNKEIDVDYLYKKLRLYWREKKVSEKNWKEWSSRIQLKWRIKN
jgi:hypothetical protein